MDASSYIGVSLSSVGKCRSANVNNELRSSFLLKWRNPLRKNFNYWLRFTLKIVCLVQACRNCTTDFRKADKSWKLKIAQAVDAQLLQMTTWKCARCDSERPKVGCSSSSWRSQFGQGKCSTTSKGKLYVRNFCAEMVAKLLSDEQLERHKELCLDPLQRTENEVGLLNSIISCDETWVFTYDLETKRQSMQWKSTSSPGPKKHPWVFRSTRPRWLLSLISRVMWWQSVYPAARR